MENQTQVLDPMSSYRQDSDNDKNKRNKNYAKEMTITEGGVSNILRVLYRKVDPTTNKPDTRYTCVRLKRSWINCDDDKKRPFVVENDWQGKSLILSMLGDKDNWYRGGVLESRKGANNKKEYIYEAAHPDVIDSVAYNNDRDAEYNSGWKPSTEYLFNVIDRGLEELPEQKGQKVNWCNAFRKTKVLRIKQAVFDVLFETMANDGDFIDYDINYTVRKNEQGKRVHSLPKAGAMVAGAVSAPLSASELEYELWDLKDVARLASATYILKHLTNRITAIDTAMGTNYITQLQEQSEIEKATWAAQKAASGESENDCDDDATTGGDAIDPAALAAAQAPQPQPVITQAPPRMMRNMPVPTAGDSAQEPCPSCQAMIPVGVAACPSCKTVLLAPCNNCQKNFSTFAMTCPHCGQKYD